MMCDAVTGECLHNCSSGWTGPHCDQRMDIFVFKLYLF